MGETISAGKLQFFVENRRAGEDGGPSLQVLGSVEAQTVQLLRFDMFYKQPHYHYAPNGLNIRYNVDQLVVNDTIGWVMGLLKGKLPELLTKAGYASLVTTIDAPTVVEALPGIETRWREQKDPESSAPSGAMH